MSRRLLAGTGWKMNLLAAQAAAYAADLRPRLAAMDTAAIDMFVLPPFTTLAAASAALVGTGVAIGGQNMHWEADGAWTGEISAAMLLDTGCQYVELAHSERLAHFGETYDAVRRKVDRAVASGLTPIVCLGETADEKQSGRGDEVLAWQVQTALAGLADRQVPDTVLAYEPRWAIGSRDAASPAYIAARHRALRDVLAAGRGPDVAQRTRIIYGGSVTPANGRDIIALDDVDGLFVGRAAWRAEGFAQIVALVAEAARCKARPPAT